MAEYEKSSSISRERARRILEGRGRGELYDEGGDYYLAWTADGRELLAQWGQDGPLLENHSAQSWVS